MLDSHSDPDYHKFWTDSSLHLLQGLYRTYLHLGEFDTTSDTVHVIPETHACLVLRPILSVEVRIVAVVVPPTAMHFPTTITTVSIVIVSVERGKVLASVSIHVVPSYQRKTKTSIETNV